MAPNLTFETSNGKSDVTEIIIVHHNTQFFSLNRGSFNSFNNFAVGSFSNNNISTNTSFHSEQSNSSSSKWKIQHSLLFESERE